MKVFEPSLAPIPTKYPIGIPGKILLYDIHDKFPDSHSIVSALQFFIEQFGRSPVIRIFVESILTSKRNNDVETNSRTLFEWVKEKMVYMRDPEGSEYVKSPLVLIPQIMKDGFAYGDCDDHVLLLGSFFITIGIPVKVAGVKINNSIFYNHVILMASINGEIKDFDPCAKEVAAKDYDERLIPR